MKKTFVLILVLAAAMLLLTACGKAGAHESKQADEIESSGSVLPDAARENKEGSTEAVQEAPDTPDEAEPLEPVEADAVGPDFKEMLDNYEAFMDKYIEFMEKYENSDDTLGMLADYASMMTEYADFAAQIDEINTDELSNADYEYYTEVMLRVSQKLASAAV